MSYSPAERNPERYADVLPKPVVRLHESSEEENVDDKDKDETEDEREKELRTLR